MAASDSRIGEAQQAIFSPVQTGPQTYSGLFRQAQAGIGTQTALDVPDTTFFASPHGTILTMASQGYYLTNVDIQVANATRYYNAVFESGIAPTQFWDLAWNDFQAKVSALDATGVRLINLKSYLVNNTRFYSGIFQQGSALQAFPGATDYVTLLGNMRSFANQGYYLTNVDVFISGGTEHYLGVWRHSGTPPAFWVGDWNGFAKEYLEEIALGNRLIDMRTWETGLPGTASTRRYAGVWQSGNDNYDVVAATAPTVFNGKLNGQGTKGNVPIRINFENGYQPPIGMAAAFHEYLDWGGMGYGYSISEQNDTTALGGFGYARAPWESSNPALAMTSDVRLDIASVTKAVTAVATLKLLEDPNLSGGITLDSAFLPFVADTTCGKTCPAGTACIQGACITLGFGVTSITVAELLEMRSGLDPNLDCGSTTWLQDVITKGTHFTPGSQTEYGGVSWCILRQMIENRIGGGAAGFEAYLNSALFLPLGIGSPPQPTPNCHPDHSSPTRPLYYSAAQTSGPGSEGGNDAQWEAACGGGALQMSAKQLGAFARGLAHNNVLTAADYAMMTNSSMGVAAVSTVSGSAYVKDGTSSQAGPGGTTSVLALLPNDTQLAITMNTSGGNLFQNPQIEPWLAGPVGFSRMYSYPTGTYFVLHNVGENGCASIWNNSTTTFSPLYCSANSDCGSKSCVNNTCSCTTDSQCPYGCKVDVASGQGSCSMYTPIIPFTCLAPSALNQVFIKRATPTTGHYMLESLRSGKCLSVELDGPFVGRVIQADCAGQTNQTFTINAAGGGAYNIVSDLSGNPCVDDNGANLVRSACVVGSLTQQWNLNVPNANIVFPSGRAFVLKAASSGRCATIQGNSAVDNAPFIQFSCQSPVVTNQLFAWQSVGDGHFTLTAVNSGKCLTVEYASISDGTSLIQYDCLGQTNQTFTLQPTGDGDVSIVNDNSGKCVTVLNNSMNDNAALVQFSCLGAGHLNQEWTFSNGGG